MAIWTQILNDHRPMVEEETSVQLLTVAARKRPSTVFTYASSPTPSRQTLVLRKLPVILVLVRQW
jgi:hypothetical protein